MNVLTPMRLHDPDRRQAAPLRRAALGVALMLLAAGTASAQLTSPFGRESIDHVTDEDRRLAEEASAKIYKPSSPQIGTSESWDNPATGNHGTVTLVRFREYQGLPCRTLRHIIYVKDRDRQFEFVIDRCRTSDGQWKLL
jgi:surface antigen